MDTLDLKTIVRRRLTVARILWMAMLGSIPIYFVIIYLVTQQGRLAELPGTHRLVGILAFLGAILAAVSFLVPRLLLSDARLKAALEADVTAESLAPKLRDGTMPSLDAERLRALSGSDRQFLSALDLWLRTAVIQHALRESVALLGVVAVFLGSPLFEGLIFLAAGFLLLLMGFPRIDLLVARVRAAKPGFAPGIESSVG